MTTYYVRKDGSGTHVDIQGAIYDAISGDVVDIGVGTWNENIEVSKSITIQGAGKELTIIQGKYGNDVVAGCSFYSNENVITMPSTAGIIKGRPISATYFPAGARVAQVISATQIRISGYTTGTFTRVASNSYAVGATTVVVNSTGTAPVAGNRMYSGTTLLGTVSAFNTTTRAITLTSGITQAITAGATLTFGALRSNISVTQSGTFPGGYGYGTIMVVSTPTTGFQIKNLQARGFDVPSAALEGGVITIASTAAPGHQNFVIDGCKFVADGEAALLTGNNPYLVNGTVQNCEFAGKTFSGNEPANVQGFSTFAATATFMSAGASTSNLQVSNDTGIIVGSTLTSPSFTGTATVSAISAGIITINKVITAVVGDPISCTFTNIQFTVPNVARQLVCFGNSSSVTNTTNTTFKNNLCSGQTGAVISSTGAKTMFNSALTVDTVGGLVEGNVINGTFGAGTPNPVAANYAIRARGANTVVRNNSNVILGGRGNSGFYVPGAGSVNQNNVNVDTELVQATQPSVGEPFAVSMSKPQIKSLSAVYGHPTLNSEANWKQVSFVYKKDGSVKRLVAAFRSFSEVDVSKIKLKGAVSGETYKLHKIIVADSSRNIAVTKREDILGASGYDITVA